jgi:hypothetical protein
VTFAAITLCVASQQVSVVVTVVSLSTQSGNFRIHPRTFPPPPPKRNWHFAFKNLKLHSSDTIYVCWMQKKCLFASISKNITAFLQLKAISSHCLFKKENVSENYVKRPSIQFAYSRLICSDMPLIPWRLRALLWRSVILNKYVHVEWRQLRVTVHDLTNNLPTVITLN